MSKVADYKVLARTMRPQQFKDVIGQEKIKTTLKNAYQLKRLGHAYLFCGSHGIGKTTLARLFAKVLNCDNPLDGEPCNQCSSCSEIANSNALNVIEIDGASNRGIDDIRQINESVGFAVDAGKYKIYILDEVHMLTKEAFNALLKTLEEPPAKVKFLFATTEPHKIPTTILSRCQCFYLEPLTVQEIAEHLALCIKAQQASCDLESPYLIAQRANGSLRDALVLTEQLISYCKGQLTHEKVSHFLGLFSKSQLFQLDQKGAQGDLSFALAFAKSIIDSGKNISCFLDTMADHFRQILYIKIFKGNPSCLTVSKQEWADYEKSSHFYSYEQCLYIIDLILEAQNKIRFALSKPIIIENLLIQIVRSHQRVSVQSLIEQLDALKNNISTNNLKQDVYKEKPPMMSEPVSPKATPTPIENVQKTPPPPTIVPQVAPPKETSAENPKKCYNTLIQFAAVELEGSFKKKESHG